jgi:hypothetical protein
MAQRKTLGEAAKNSADQFQADTSEHPVRVVSFGDFSIVTRCQENRGYAPSAIITAHGTKVGPNEKRSSFLGFFSKTVNQTFKCNTEYFRLGADDSAVQDVGYPPIMRACSKLVAGIKEDEAELGKINPPGEEKVDNVWLHPYQRENPFTADEKKEDIPLEIDQVKKAVAEQAMNVWDIIVINKPTTLEDVIRRLEEENITYNRVIGYHCSVRHDGLDNAATYRAGYTLDNQQ